MSGWYDVSVIAACIEQQIDAGLSDLEAVATDTRAMMHVSQAKHAMRELAMYARGEVKQPPPVLAPAVGNPVKQKIRLLRRPLIVEFPAIHKRMCAVACVPENLFADKSRPVQLVTARRAMAYLYYYGIRWQVDLSMPHLAGLLGMGGHASLVTQMRCAPSYASELSRALYDECDRAQIETNPRPVWARKEQV